jgi:hypothetical protein
MRLVNQTNKPQRAHVLRLLAPLSLLAFAFISAYANAQVAPQNPAPNPPTKTAGPTPSPASAPNKSKYSRICTENERMWCLQQHIGQKASQEITALSLRPINAHHGEKRSLEPASIH